MRERGHGTIVNIGSLTGTFPPPFQSAYAATKLGPGGVHQVAPPGSEPRAAFGSSLVIPGYIRTFIEPRMIVPEGFGIRRRTRRLPRKPGTRKWTSHPRPTSAAAKILRVMEKKNPGPVYYTGHLVPAMGFLKRVLPERTAQRMIRGFYKLDR